MNGRGAITNGGEERREARLSSPFPWLGCFYYSKVKNERQSAMGEPFLASPFLAMGLALEIDEISPCVHVVEFPPSLLISGTAARYPLELPDCLFVLPCAL